MDTCAESKSYHVNYACFASKNLILQMYYAKSWQEAKSKNLKVTVEVEAKLNHSPLSQRTIGQSCASQVKVLNPENIISF